MLTKFEIKDCPPPPYRPDHELRVVMREAIPRLLTEQLPPGTVHFDAGVTDVTTTPTGNRALAFSHAATQQAFMSENLRPRQDNTAKLHQALYRCRAASSICALIGEACLASFRMTHHCFVIVSNALPYLVVGVGHGWRGAV